MYYYPLQTDIFGECPVDYRISGTDPDLFYTERNLRFCEMPQIYQRPRNIFSMVQKSHGGYKIGKVLEVNSIYACFARLDILEFLSTGNRFFISIDTEVIDYHKTS